MSAPPWWSRMGQLWAWRAAAGISVPSTKVKTSRAEIGALDVRVAEQLGAGAGDRHAPLFQNIGAIGELESSERILLHHHHCDALGANVLDDLKGALDQVGRQAKRRLVEQHELGPRHQGARDRQHLL